MLFTSQTFTRYASRFTLHLSLTKIGLAGLLVAGLAGRLWRIDAAFWYDEAFSAALAKLTLERLLAATVGDVHPPAYYLLLWLVNQAMGVSEMTMRLPSLLAGLALILVVYRLGYSLEMSPKAVWVATGLTAVAPFQIYYSQEARSYALLMLAVALAALGLLERRAWLFVIASLAALYLHHMAAPFVCVQTLLAVTARRWPWPKLAIILGCMGIGFLPGALLTLYQMGQISGNYWIPPLSSPGRIISTLDDLIFFSPGNTFVLASGLITALGLALLCADWRYWYDRPFLMLVNILPVAIIAAASLLWQPVFISRIVAPLAPFYYLWLAESVTRSRSRWMLWFTATIATIISIVVVGSIAGSMGRQPGKDIYTAVPIQPGDAVYHANVGSYLIWSYYRPDVPQYVWPNKNGLDQSLSSPTKAAMGLSQADFDTVACSARRWWLIYFNNPTTGQAEIDHIAHLERDYPSERVIRLRSDSTVEAWVVRIEPSCSTQAAH